MDELYFTANIVGSKAGAKGDQERAGTSHVTCSCTCRKENPQCNKSRPNKQISQTVFNAGEWWRAEDEGSLRRRRKKRIFKEGSQGHE